MGNHMGTTQLPIDVLPWIFALIPIVVLVVLLVVLRWTAPQAAAVGMFTSAVIAYLVFRTPLETLAVAGAKGVWDAIFILAVVWPALLLYQVVNHAGGYDALRQGIARFSRNEVFVVIALGWVFTSFVQGIDGFGTPIVVVAPILVAFGMRPVYAVAIPIIAHIWAKLFGTLGVGWLATLQVISLADPISTAFASALLILLQVVLGGFTVVWMYGRWPAVRHAWPVVLIISAIQGGGQMIVALYHPALAAFIPATAALIVLYPLSRWRRFAEPADGITERPAMREDRGEAAGDTEPPMGLAMSFLPYILLTVIALLVLTIKPIDDLLGRLTFGLPFPQVTTGYGVRNAMTPGYSPLALLTHPGAFLVLTAVITWIIYRARGYFDVWAARRQAAPVGILRGTLADAVPASVPIIGFLMMAKFMDHSGQNQVLALGISAVAPAYAFAFLSNGIGALGAFMTSSSTSSNVLFAPLQQTIAHLHGLPETTIIAAQSAGGAIGNAIAPANVVLGASTAGISGQEGEIIRKTLPWTIAMVVLTGIATVVMVWLG
jgi:lactate permease